MNLFRHVISVVLSASSLLLLGSANGQPGSQSTTQGNSAASAKKLPPKGTVRQDGDPAAAGKEARKPRKKETEAYKIQDPCDKRPDLPQCGISGPKK